jgi:hypothetical protein
MLLGHVEVAPHGESLTALVRLGSLLPLALIMAWAALVRLRRGDGRDSLAIGAALTLGGAGAVHLALAPDHAEESAAAGAFFVAVGVSQLVLAGLVGARRGGRGALAGLLGVAAVVLSVYVASRSFSLPGGLDRERVDAVGLLTKLLEMAGTGLGVASLTGRPRHVPISGEAALAATTLTAALIARPVFGLGPGTAQVVAVLLGALATTALLGSTSLSTVQRAVADAATLSLLLRLGGSAPFLVAGAAAALVRVAARRLPVPLVAPLAVAALGVLVLPGAGGRFEILHVAHHDQPWDVLVGLLLAAVLVLVARNGGGLPAVGAFFAAHLALQGLRLLTGRTSLEAIEVPAASLGLLLVAAVVLADPDLLRGRRGRGATAGLIAGVVDVALRDAGVPYPALLAVAAGVAAVGIPAPLADHARRLAPSRQPGKPGMPARR